MKDNQSSFSSSLAVFCVLGLSVSYSGVTARVAGLQ